MTRRSFITDMLKVGIATTFLPGAGRIWKPNYQPVQAWFSEPIQFSEMAVHKPDALNLQELFKMFYDLKRKREAAGTDNAIERFVDRSFFDTTCHNMEFPNKHTPLNPAVKGIWEQMHES